MPISMETVKITVPQVQDLADLALTVANYETAWRQSLVSEGDEKGAADAAMRLASLTQERICDSLVTSGLAPDLVAGIHGAMILASCRPEGIRPDAHRDTDSSFASRGNAYKFIREHITGSR